MLEGQSSPPSTKTIHSPLHATLIIPGDRKTTLHYCARHFIAICQDAISKRGCFTVALSGGETPKSLYEILCRLPYCSEIRWEKIHVFWSDERPVPPDHPESNYTMALKSGFLSMPIPSNHFHRMKAETDIEHQAKEYQEEIKRFVADKKFDLIMLGVGNDGHTASLFPQTQALTVQDQLVVANYIPEKTSWRMTLTFPCINLARHTVFYVFGCAKAKILGQIFSTSLNLPCQQIGSLSHPATWIVDEEAASLL